MAFRPILARAYAGRRYAIYLTPLRALGTCGRCKQPAFLGHELATSAPDVDKQHVDTLRVRLCTPCAFMAIDWLRA